MRKQERKEQKHQLKEDLKKIIEHLEIGWLQEKEELTPILSDQQIN